ncbi:MAG: hypothetical protein M3Q03_15270 [Chloroflexota bacterium]|nr:hypothetical protein [Chloroflexota bacterium]
MTDHPETQGEEGSLSTGRPGVDDEQARPIVHCPGGYRVVWWLPLPDPIGLPDRYTFGFAVHRDWAEFSKLLTEYDEGTRLEHPISERLVFYLTVLQVQGTWTRDDLAGLFRLSLDRTRSRRRHNPMRSLAKADLLIDTRSVVEVDVRLPPGNSPTEAEIGDVFDTVLNHVQRVQRAYHRVSHWPMRLATRPTLPSTLPMADGPLSADGTVEGWRPRPAMSVFVVNLNFARQFDPGALDKDGLAEFHAAVDRDDIEPFGNYVELRRESSVALHRVGDYKSTVLAAATASEVLLDDLLLHLMWEQGTRPEDAYGRFADPRQSVIRRVKTEYPPRLGGTWDPDRPGPLQDWASAVLGVRHRSIHAGYMPTPPEAEKSLSALLSLERLLADAVAQRNAHFPRTALVFLGEDGLKRRDLLSRRLRQLADSRTEVQWRPTFARWRDAVTRLRADAAGIGVAPDETRANLLLVLQPGGDQEWVLHDAVAGRAALVEPMWERLPTPQLQGLQATVRAHTNMSLDEAAAFHVVRVPTPSRLEDWVEQHRRVPGAGVMVNQQDRY